MTCVTVNEGVNEWMSEWGTFSAENDLNTVAWIKSDKIYY
jgi:hypothetical protein